MKIGILTYHRSHNYGALLQSIALRYVLCNLGHEVTFVDYWPDYHKRMYKLFNWKKALSIRHPKSSLRYVCHSMLTRNTLKKRIINANSFISNFIEPFCSSVNESYDVLIYGSDQIWRKQPENYGYNPIYFGKHNIKANKNISYAASMGLLPASEKDDALLKELVSHLDFISVRENNLKDYLSTIGYSNVTVCLDPTLLLSQKDWLSLIPEQRIIKGRYFLFYEVQKNSFDEVLMGKFAKSHDAKLIIIRINSLKRETEEEYCAFSPDQFVNLIRFADFVFTSSFHGLAFSIIHQKQFCASFSKNADRALSLLADLDIKEHYITPMSIIPETFSVIDYTNVVLPRLSSLKSNSYNYITNIVLSF